MLLYICTKFHENILDGIKVIEQTRFSSEKFQRVIISQKMYGELQFLFPAYCLILVYFSTQFHENIFDRFLCCREGMIFILIISKGHNSAKNVDALCFFFYPHHLVTLNISI